MIISFYYFDVLLMQVLHLADTFVTGLAVVAVFGVVQFAVGADVCVLHFVPLLFVDVLIIPHYEAGARPYVPLEARKRSSRSSWLPGCVGIKKSPYP